MHYDWLVVGTGLTGATFAERLATQCGARVLVIDRRPHVAGNAHDCRDDAGILVHRYGAHIFHTSSQRVWSYLSQFTTWRPYRHKVVGSVDGRMVPIPFNLNTLHALLPRDEASRLEARLVDLVGYGSKIPVLRLLEHPDPELKELGSLVYEKVFAHYSAKQWGKDVVELDRSVTGRVPVVVSHDDHYFHDRYQGIPSSGYTAMVHRMLDHPNVTVEVDTEFADVRERVRADRILYTGPIDELFEYRLGHLPYRSLRFESVRRPGGLIQPTAVVNYPDCRPYTRILEHRHLTGQVHQQTVLTTEYPQVHSPGQTDPYYPVPTPRSRSLYEAYRTMKAERHPDMLLAGRLADYKYYDMDQAVSRALILFRHRVLRRAGVRPVVAQVG